MTNYMCYISTTSVLDKHNRCVKKQFDTLSAVLTHQNSQDNTPEIFCAPATCIPELGQKCWLDRPDSLPTQIKRGSLGTRLDSDKNHKFMKFVSIL